jgi:hypothetical protein
LDFVGLQLRQPSLDDVFLSLTGRVAESADPRSPGASPVPSRELAR